MGFPGSSVGKESACSAGDPDSIPGSGRSTEEGRGYHSSILVPCGSAGKESTGNKVDPGFDPWLGRFPWRRERLPTPVFWPGESHGQYSLWGHKESDTTEQLSFSLSVVRNRRHVKGIVIKI